MITPEEELRMWKEKCLHAEKAHKAMTELADSRKLQLIELHANLSMWKNRAENAEKILRELNE